MSDGILHSLAESASWKNEFDAELSELLSSIANEESDQENEGNEEAAEKLKQMAKALADHPKFSATKSSHAKRCYLAEQLYPDIEQNALVEVVELADNMAWYAKSND